ncbi:hypothetical protein LshimejAT787_0411080 [Lyophyllum shimeji]|uniref:Uncharacterized protein n=1 Tax=Lyophyllum shimeji TaxID=47721 RepID=A0A9P3PMK4_LYOSH|nr:hypothetical protein LshimejAT787_0411080 [Lyophyllum shimeji]
MACARVERGIEEWEDVAMARTDQCKNDRWLRQWSPDLRTLLTLGRFGQDHPPTLDIGRLGVYVLSAEDALRELRTY